MLTKHVIAFNSSKFLKNMFTGVRYVFFDIIWLCLSKVNRRYDPLYRKSIFSRRLLFMRVAIKKELKCIWKNAVSAICSDDMPLLRFRG